MSSRDFMRKPGSRLAYARRERLAAVQTGVAMAVRVREYLFEPELCEFPDIGICAEC
jgi:hypothetical protein